MRTRTLGGVIWRVVAGALLRHRGSQVARDARGAGRDRIPRLLPALDGQH